MGNTERLHYTEEELVYLALKQQSYNSYLTGANIKDLSNNKVIQWMPEKQIKKYLDDANWATYRNGNYCFVTRVIARLSSSVKNVDFNYLYPIPDTKPLCINCFGAKSFNSSEWMDSINEVVDYLQSFFKTQDFSDFRICKSPTKFLLLLKKWMDQNCIGYDRIFVSYRHISAKAAIQAGDDYYLNVSRIEHSFKKSLNDKAYFQQNQKLTYVNTLICNDDRLEKCKKFHGSKPLSATVELYKEGRILSKTIEIFLCEVCGELYISAEKYKELLKYGVPRCRVVKEVVGGNNNRFITYNAESKLKSFGYTVSKLENLSEDARRFIITDIIENGFMSREEIIKHLTWLISERSSNSKMKDAVEKWKADKNYLIRSAGHLSIKSFIRKV